MKKNTKRILVTCAAAAFTMGTAMMSYAAYGWQQEDGQWHYYDKNGDRVTDEWKRSGNNWYWLDENGDMAVSQLVQDDDEYYYVNETGVMVANQWRELENEDADDDESDTSWYYFGPNGKAYTASDSGKTTFKPLSGQTASLKNMPLMKTEKCFTAGSMKKVSGRPVMTPGKTEYIIWARPETER